MQYNWVELYDSFVFISLEIISDSKKIQTIEIIIEFKEIFKRNIRKGVKII